METSDWLLVVASVVLGQFALLAIELLRGQLERWQRRRDQRDDFQRQALLDLQEALATYDRTARTVWVDRVQESVDKELNPADPLGLPPIWRSQTALQHWAEYNDAAFRVDILRERAGDDRLRALVAGLQDATRRAVNPLLDAPRSTELVEPATLRQGAYAQVTARIGELIRKL
ncbi:MAG: hypothetical protein M3Q10_00640 [Chloroflexota bacterium]|nr:hypothetical protein [Chloroflexota bacterium]